MKNNKKGFTLVELVIVVAVMAVLVAVAIPTVGAITGRASTAVENSNARTIESVIKLAEAEASKGSDGVATLDEEAVANAIVAAKLGIDAGKTYQYDLNTGAVKAGTGTKSATLFNITFAADSVKVEGTATFTAPYVEAEATDPTT